MLLRTPHFYPHFRCIASNCSDTCCVGWEIDVDEKSQAKYRRLLKKEFKGNRQKFIEKLLKQIEDGHFKLLPGDRCPFLKEDGLCEMICELGTNGTDIGDDGESILCDICKEHPRFVEVYGDIMEKGIGLCCEEGARLLLESGRLQFIESEIDDEPDEMPEGALEARNAIFVERERIFNLLANQSKPLNQRLIDVIDFVESINTLEEATAPSTEPPSTQTQESSIPHSWLTVLNEGESYGPAWDKAYERMTATSSHEQSIFSDEDGERIVAYMIFRYYAKCLFDGDCITKVQFAIFFWIILQHFGKELAEGSSKINGVSPKISNKINAIKLLSKQTEYSDEIMEILADHFYKNSEFNLEQFRKILQ